MDYRELISLIDEIGGLNIPDFHESESDSYHKQYWNKCNRIKDEFKETRFPSKEEKQEQWERYWEYRNEANNRSNNRWEDKKSISKSHKNYILSEIAASEPNDLFGFSIVNKNELISLGKRLSNAMKYMSKYKDEMIGKHKNECFESGKEMREIHDSWWEGFKDEMERIRENKNARHEEYLERVRNRLDINYEKLEKAKDAAQRVRDHIENLNDNISSAWNDDYIDRAQGWLSEAEDKLQNIEEWIDKLESWISDDEDKL